jgi:hypothetical protein
MNDIILGSFRTTIKFIQEGGGGGVRGTENAEKHWIRQNQILHIKFHILNIIFFCLLLLYIQIIFFLWGIQTKLFCGFLAMYFSYPAHVIDLELRNPVTFTEEWKIWSVLFSPYSHYFLFLGIIIMIRVEFICNASQDRFVFGIRVFFDLARRDVLSVFLLLGDSVRSFSSVFPLSI